MPDLSDGQVLLRTVYLSLDPYMRGRMSAAESYADPVEVGDVMVGGTVSRVLESRNPRIAAGTYVLGYTGWQTHAVVDGDTVRPLDPDRAPLSTALGVLGMPGFTAYSGLLKIGRPQAGETVVVAAAAGPVGSAVGQIAQIHGARAVGIAGGPTSARTCATNSGSTPPSTTGQRISPTGCVPRFRAAWTSTSRTSAGRSPRQSCRCSTSTPGSVVRVGLPVQCCDNSEGPDRLPGFMGLVLTKSLTVRGFIQSEFVAEMYADFERDASRWIAEGRLKYREDVVHGLDNAPSAFLGMLHGKNFGKLVVRVGPEE